MAHIPGASNLTNAVINLGALRDGCRRELVDVLDSIVGKKALVLDPSLSGPLGLVAEVSLIKEHGVDGIFHLSDNSINTDLRSIIYITRPNPEWMRKISSHVRQHQKSGITKEYAVYFVPRRTMVCERILEEEGVYGNLFLGEYNLNLIPIDDDILSLELENSFRELYLENDRSCLFSITRALMDVQKQFGVIPNIRGKGTFSKVVADMIIRSRMEEHRDDAPPISEIDTLILIDRGVDFFTPLSTQLTYEGLIDEIFQLRNGYVELDADILPQNENKQGDQEKVKKNVKVPLNSNDKLYSECRDMHYTACADYLNKRAKYVRENTDERHSAQTISQIRDFMKKLPSLQQEKASISLHTNIATKILERTKDEVFRQRVENEQRILQGKDNVQEYIEDCIYRKEDLNKVLRILSLLSLTKNGLKPKMYESLWRDILQTYGYHEQITMQNFEKVGLIKKFDTGKSSWSVIRNALRLNVDNVTEQNPNDIAYTHGGYAPLSVRIIQAVLKHGMGHKAVDEVLKLMPGPQFETKQSTGDGMGAKTGVTMVFFIGGVTHSELAAFRFLEQKQEEEGIRRDYIIATTKLINGDTMLDNIRHQHENALGV